MRAQVTIEDLARVLSTHPNTIRGSAIRSPSAIAKLVEMGVLVPSGIVGSVLCDRCDSPHFSPVKTNEEGQGWYCPEDGFVVADAVDIAAYSVHAEAFVALLAKGMDRHRWWAKPRAAPLIWSVGSLAFSNLQVAVYFALNMGTPDILSDVLQILSGEPRTDGIAVLTNDTRDFSHLTLPRPGCIVSIVDCLSIISGGELVIDRDWLARRVLPEHLLRPPKPGRPNSAEKLAAELIEELNQDGKLGELSGNARHRALLAAAKNKLGPLAKLSKAPCDKAWAAYLASTSRKLGSGVKNHFGQ